jgi:UDP-glucose 4-epimerase
LTAVWHRAVWNAATQSEFWYVEAGGKEIFMQLITGGMGFIGLHTARALLEMGESCVLTQYRVARVPDFIQAEIGRRVFVERLDITNRSALLEIGGRHAITGIIHLADPGPWRSDPQEYFRLSMNALLNILEAAETWKARRVAIASTIGIYMGLESSGVALREDLPLPMLALHPIPTFKKVAELISSNIASRAGFSIVHTRFGAWGPLFHHPPSPMNIHSQLVRAAVAGETLDFTRPPARAYAEDGVDLCYVKDCGRGIALLQLADNLHHSTYNIGTGKATKYGELVEAIQRIIPDARLDLPSGYDPQGPGVAVTLDIARIREDTGFEPQYDLERAVADYMGWLRAGNAE